MSPGITARRLGVRFTFDRQQRPVTPALARLRRRCSESWGLRGVDLEIGSGESVALLGPNGAGKTTLLRAIAGVFAPDTGVVEVRGRIGSLLSVDGGLLPRLTGRENVLLLGVLAGLSRGLSRQSVEQVKERSGLDQAFERPVSSYSQGMRARLGFAVIEESQPQILLLDEVHEALDQEFRDELEARARSILASGGIVVAAGHDRAELERICERAVLLEAGRLRADGRFAEVAGMSRTATRRLSSVRAGGSIRG
jgi:lipopolysaccharide transport system ATP-binding protein